MVAERVSQDKLAIVGGGISGLSAAYYALKQSIPGQNIDVYEASGRLGGKIESGVLDGQLVNKGAEFIDSEHTQLITLCQELGVRLDRSEDQGALTFQRPDGQRMSEKKFLAAYRPISEQIIRHKAEVRANPNGALARQLNAMSLNDYLNVLGNAVPVHAHRGLLHRFFDFVTFKTNRVNPDILQMAKQAYASEAGQSAGRISGLQFVHEASATPNAVLASDCAYRVAGGMEQIIHALRAKLEAQGVRFHSNAKVTSLAKEGSGIRLSFANDAMSSALTDKVIMALPAYELAKVQGLDAFGLAPQAQQLIGETQYTKNIKFTVKLKDGAKVDSSNFFSPDGFQCWTAAPGQLTFLCNAAALQSMSMPQYLQACMESYARAHGTTADALFDRGPGKLVLTNPGKSPCYASPAPGQVMALERLGTSLDTLAGNGVGIAGTFLPNRTPQGSLEIGFMECGVHSAQHACEQLLSKETTPVRWADKIRVQQATRGAGSYVEI